MSFQSAVLLKQDDNWCHVKNGQECSGADASDQARILIGVMCQDMASQDPGRYSVYLRIKPADISRITDDVTGFTVEENSVVVTSNRKRDELQRDEFKFTNVFRPSCSQTDIFDAVVFPRLEDFVNGEDSLIFSYGTTNSGKSFTMQGTPSCPGIIPRALWAIFLSIADSIERDFPLTPYKNKSVAVLNGKARQQILKTKEDILATVAGSSGSGDVTITSTLPENMMMPDDNEMPPLSFPYSDCKVGVWVSFYEIYNESLNDLLTLEDNPKTLKVVNDTVDDSFYPEGLLHVPVTSWAEAFDVYRAGKKKLQVSSTLMNRQSSRSHCVFSLKLLVRPTSDATSFYDLSTLCFCDLAGNERVSHLEGTAMPTTAGKKETLKINSSLLALNKCFVTLKSNLGKPTSAMPSFRDSKLTMVFKRFLTGRGKLSMLANISQDPDMLASTHHILKMTAIAVDTKIHVTKPEAVPRCRRFSIAHGTLDAHAQPAPTPRLETVHEGEALVTPRQNDEPDVVAAKSEVKAKDRAINELKRELEDAKNYIKELEDENDRLLDRQLQESASTQRRDDYTRDLEGKLREYHKKELQMLARLHNYQDLCEDLFEQLADEFVVDSTEPAFIVSMVVHKHNEALNMAKEEINELNQENDSLNRQLEEGILRESSLKVELMQMGSELELEKELNASLRAQMEDIRKRLENPGSGLHGDSSASGYDATTEEGTFSHRPVRAHKSLRWVSDEEDSPRVPPRCAATSTKKRKPRKKKDVVPEAEPEIVVPRRATRRRLLPRAAGTDHLPASGIDVSVQELQPSPNTIMRSARR